MALDTKEKRRELREMAAYGINEAAHYLGIPKATLRSWVMGRPYLTETGKRFFRPVIELPEKDQFLLSFVNLVEAHVLDAIRRAAGTDPHYAEMAAEDDDFDNLRQDAELGPRFAALVS